MRNILRKLDRCDVCLQRKQHHKNKCYNITRGQRPRCYYCGKRDHETITCDGGKHPGSWISKERSWLENCRKRSELRPEEEEIDNDTKGDFSITGMIIIDLQGKEQICKVRALLDKGAGTNFVASEVLKHIKYETITE